MLNMPKKYENAKYYEFELSEFVNSYLFVEKELHKLEMEEMYEFPITERVYNCYLDAIKEKITNAVENDHNFTLTVKISDSDWELIGKILITYNNVTELVMYSDLEKNDIKTRDMFGKPKIDKIDKVFFATYGYLNQFVNPKNNNENPFTVDCWKNWKDWKILPFIVFLNLPRKGSVYYARQKSQIYP